MHAVQGSYTADNMQDSLMPKVCQFYKYDKSTKSPMPTYTWCPVSLVYLSCMAYSLATT